MGITVSELRANLYQLLDQVIATGTPLEIERRGHMVRIMAVQPPSRLAKLPRREDYINGDADDLTHIDWSTEWTP